jgi:hypothetical protein
MRTSLVFEDLHEEPTEGSGAPHLNTLSSHVTGQPE